MLPSTLFQQYFIILSIVLALTLSLCSVSAVISSIGSAAILLVISWRLAKYIYRYRANTGDISSFGKAVLITGCDSGFGNRLAFKLNESGFVVYATVLDAESDGAKFLRTQTVFPDAIKLIRVNVKIDADVRDAYEFVTQHLEENSDLQLWGLVNNAGISYCGHVDWGTMNTYENMVDVNVFGMVRVTRAFLPLIRQSKGRIVNMSSMSGKISVPLSACYCMTKYAVRSFTDALRRELANCGVNVSIIMPSAFKTNIVDSFEQCFDRVWINTDESVKEVYGGQQYFDDKKRAIMDITISSANKNIDLVVDAIIDALRSVSPKLCYDVAGDWGSYLFVTLVDYIPDEWFDKLFALMQ